MLRWLTEIKYVVSAKIRCDLKNLLASFYLYFQYLESNLADLSVYLVSLDTCQTCNLRMLKLTNGLRNIHYKFD